MHSRDDGRDGHPDWDDDSDGIARNSDDVINRAADQRDMGKAVAEFGPAFDNDTLKVHLSVDNASVVRVFGAITEGCLLGPGLAVDALLAPYSGMTGFLVEGVGVGVETGVVLWREAKHEAAPGEPLWLDDVYAKVANRLDELPQGALHLPQPKDTKLLCVDKHAGSQAGKECASGAGVWDDAHGEDCDCEHSSVNCARACVAMVNHYYGGDLSQDRIAFESRAQYAGSPQGGDLGHGKGLVWLTTPLDFAVDNDGVVAQAPVNATAGLQWILNCLGEYRPVAIQVPAGPNITHLIAISGANGDDASHLHDPWEALPEWVNQAQVVLMWLYAPANPPARPMNGNTQDDMGDTNSNGMLDLDETRSPNMTKDDVWAAYKQ